MEAMADRVREVVEGFGLPFEVIPCDPAFADTAAFCAKYGVPPDRSGNTILVATKQEPRRFALCVVLADSRLDVNHAVRALLGGSKCSFASAEDTVRVTGQEIGGVTPFHLPPDLPVYVDARVMALDSVVLGGGGRTSKIRISPEVFRRLPSATVVADLSLPKT